MCMVIYMSNTATTTHIVEVQVKGRPEWNAATKAITEDHATSIAASFNKRLFNVRLVAA